MAVPKHFRDFLNKDDWHVFHFKKKNFPSLLREVPNREKEPAFLFIILLRGSTSWLSLHITLKKKSRKYSCFPSADLHAPCGLCLGLFFAKQKAKRSRWVFQEPTAEAIRAPPAGTRTRGARECGPGRQKLQVLLKQNIKVISNKL